MNRRRFLGSIAAITAALGVTRVPDSVQAAPIHVPLPNRVRTPGDTDLSRRCVSCDFRAPWSNEVTDERAKQEYELLLKHFEDAHGGAEQHTEVNWRPHDWQADIAQARADGYNRGREVEAARQEARSDPHAHCGSECGQWRAMLHDLDQWDWGNPMVVTRSGSFVAGRGEIEVTYHEPVRPA